ncbi:hypothetical protein [Ferruginibacter sp. HRS2-29]|uniref:hypothetical protein n=1 Tax=Ferruginibacter sp. HRS2-29 TaxID=2487334 RepID=UPI0020CD2507|nr:hypothetical protein [Ferruginibacter sp. HRS2-29]MCP9753194.1 hypothetical protein [Ferruginibacter sp. HRS2-29]
MNNLIDTLKIALGECKRIDTSVCLYKTSYEIIDKNFFFIADNKSEPEEPVRVVSDNENYQLRVQNRNRKSICLIKTDNCLFGDDHKKSDCILFSDDQFCLVEISESGQRNQKRNDAVEQLGSTIEILKNNDINLRQFQARAIICFKSGRTKPVQASFNTQRASFLKKYRVNLEEGNFISF